MFQHFREIEHFCMMVAIPWIEQRTRMSATVEDSPYHREPNVLVHTMMVYNEARDNFRKLLMCGSPPQYLASLSCALFHDTGKPESEIVKFSEQRGEYRAYHGHETASVYHWLDFVSENFDKILNLNGIDETNIGSVILWVAFAIEKHLPYGIKKEHKLKELIGNLNGFLEDGETLFYSQLLSDSGGRIADDPSLNAVNAWIGSVSDKKYNPFLLEGIRDDVPCVHFLIGLPGSGKSTITRDLNMPVVSMDNVRLSLIGPKSHQTQIEHYHEAFQFANENPKQFQKVYNLALEAAFNNKQSFWLDNTNLNRKARRRVIDMAQRAGFYTKAHFVITDSEKCVSRQKIRGDKTVPTNVIKSMAANMQIPLISEFNEIDLIIKGDRYNVK